MYSSRNTVFVFTPLKFSTLDDNINFKPTCGEKPIDAIIDSKDSLILSNDAGLHRASLNIFGFCWSAQITRSATWVKLLKNDSDLQKSLQKVLLHQYRLLMHLLLYQNLLGNINQDAVVIFTKICPIKLCIISVPNGNLDSWS